MIKSVVKLVLPFITILVPYGAQAVDLVRLEPTVRDALFEKIRSDETWFFGYRTKEEASFVEEILESLDSNFDSNSCYREELAVATAIQIKYNDTEEIFKKLKSAGCEDYRLYHILGFASPRNLKFFKIVENEMPKQRTSALYSLLSEGRNQENLSGKEKAQWKKEMLEIAVQFLVKNRTSEKTAGHHSDTIYYLIGKLIQTLEKQSDFQLDDGTLKHIRTLAHSIKDRNLLNLLLQFRLGETTALKDHDAATLAKLFIENGSSINESSAKSGAPYDSGVKCGFKPLTPYLHAVKLNDQKMVRIFENLGKPKTSPWGTDGWTAYALALSTGDEAWIKKMRAKDPMLPQSKCGFPVSEALLEGLENRLDISWISVIPDTERSTYHGRLMEKIYYKIYDLNGLAWSEEDRPELSAQIQKLAQTGVDLTAPFLKNLEKNCSLGTLHLLWASQKYGLKLNLQTLKNREVYKQCLSRVASGVESYSKSSQAKLTELLLGLSKQGGNEEFIQAAVSSIKFYSPVLNRLKTAKTPKQLLAIYKTHESGKTVYPKYRQFKTKPSSQVLDFNFNGISFRVNSSRISDQEFELLGLLEASGKDSKGLSLIVHEILKSHAASARKNSRQVREFMGRLMKVSQVKNSSGLKSAWENEFKSQKGEPLVYNRSAQNVFSVAHGKMQCSSGTLLNTLSLALNPSLAGDDVPVVIFTPGHVLPGFLKSRNQTWVLEGVETTVQGQGKVVFGDTRSIRQEVVVIELREFLLSTLFESRLSNRQEFVSGIKRKMEEKYGIRARTGGDESSFSFGSPNTPGGDLSRSTNEAIKVESYLQNPSFIQGPAKDQIQNPEGAIIVDRHDLIDTSQVIAGMRVFAHQISPNSVVRKGMERLFERYENYGDEFLSSSVRAIPKFSAYEIFQAKNMRNFPLSCESLDLSAVESDSQEYFQIEKNIYFSMDPVFGHVNTVCVRK